MRIHQLATAGLAALLLSGCTGNPEGLSTTSAILDPDGTTDSMRVSSGSLSCEFPPANQDAADSAERLLADEALFAAATTDAVGFAVHDYRSGLSCFRNRGADFETASIIKVATVAALLWQIEQDPSRQLTPDEQELAAAAITSSDNDAQEELWQLIGGSQGLRPFLAAAGMRATIPDSDESWGLTSTTADDQLRLIDALATDGLLSVDDRDYLLELMRNIDPEQIWGVSSGAPSGASVALKNGWLDDPVFDDAATGRHRDRFESDDAQSEATWTNNSIGYIEGATQTYSLVVLSTGNPSDEAGRDTVEAVARLVSGALFG